MAAGSVPSDAWTRKRWGRHRFNSWDLVQEPADVLTHALVGFTRPLAIAGIIMMFTCLTVGQAVMRIVLLERLRGATG